MASLQPSSWQACAIQGSDTKLGQVGGNTTRFLMVVLRICHSENRCGYGAMFLQRPGAGRSYADAANRSLERLREERVAREARLPRPPSLWGEPALRPRNRHGEAF